MSLLTPLKMDKKMAPLRIMTPGTTSAVFTGSPCLAVCGEGLGVGYIQDYIRSGGVARNSRGAAGGVSACRGQHVLVNCHGGVMLDFPCFPVHTWGAREPARCIRAAQTFRPAA